jgi:lysophospholipid acyltransferase (LPLAT)-like uncharacterized protein
VEAPVPARALAVPERGTARAERVKAALISGLATPAFAGLFRTLRWTVEGAQHYEAVLREGHQPILALWHGRILPAIYYFRSRDVVAITSLNFDGEWIARVMARFGYRAARGSTSRGGTRALVQMRRELAAGRPVAFTVDGPRGPARVAQPGAIWLAGATGHPVLPFHIEASRHWTLGSWDRSQVPRPFSTVAVVLGEPIRVAGTDPSVTGPALDRLHLALADLEARAVALVGK